MKELYKIVDSYCELFTDCTPVGTQVILSVMKEITHHWETTPPSNTLIKQDGGLTWLGLPKVARLHEARGQLTIQSIWQINAEDGWISKNGMVALSMRDISVPEITWFTVKFIHNVQKFYSNCFCHVFIFLLSFLEYPCEFPFNNCTNCENRSISSVQDRRIFNLLLQHMKYLLR